MKEMLATQASAGYTNNFGNNCGNPSTNNSTAGNSARRYAVLSTEWVGAMGEELGLYPLPDPLLRRLAEDASYRLREVLHKCVTRLKHSKRKRLTAVDVNAVLTGLCDADPIMGAPEQMPEYHTDARVFVPHERFVDLTQSASDPLHLSQTNLPFLQESEVNDATLAEARQNYAKRALKTLFNGSHKTFQVLLNDCSTNAHIGGAGVVDKLISIARSSVISTNAQYTRVSTRTCQLIIAIASNSDAVYPHDLPSVDRLTELLLELLFGKSFINPNLEILFKECALKLMLRWPSAAHRFLPMVENILLKEEKVNAEVNKKREIAMELLAGVQPLSIFQCDSNSPLSVVNIFHSAVPGSVLWQRLALSVCALVKSGNHSSNLLRLIELFGDSILPYLMTTNKNTENQGQLKIATSLPIIVRSKIKYANIKPQINIKVYADRQTAFPDSTLRGPRREIRFAFAGGRPVPPSSLRRASLRANYQILRSDLRASFALVASRRLLIFRNKKRHFSGHYNLANTVF